MFCCKIILVLPITLESNLQNRQFRNIFDIFELDSSV